MKKVQYLKIGHFSRTHGLDGGLVLTYSYDAIPEPPARIFIRTGEDYKMMNVESFSSRPDLAFIRLKEICSLEAAKAMRGMLVYIRKDSGTPSTNEKMLPDELVGLKVVDSNSGFTGIVTRVSDESGRRFLLVKDGNREIIIPLEAPFVSAIEPSEQKIITDLPDGFLDI